MNYATLYLGFRVSSPDGILNSGEPIDAEDEDVPEAAAFQISEDTKPESFALGLIHPEAQELFPAVKPKTDNHIYCLLLHLALVSNSVEYAVKPYNRINAFKGPVLPLLKPGQNPICDSRYERRTQSGSIHIAKDLLYVSGCHPLCIQCYYLVFKVIQDGLSLLYKLRFKIAVAIPRDLQI